MGGIWSSLLDGLMSALTFLYGYIGDYGWSIFVLTVAIRILMIPLTMKQTRSMHEMQRIQPKIKAIQKKYKDNKEKQQEEVVKFYNENKVNPFGGCLPMIIQMPIFIALFNVLREKLPDAIEALPAADQAAARAWDFFGWHILPDLTVTPGAVFSDSGILAAIPYLIFVVMFGLSSYLPQKMLTQDPQQSKMGLYMSIMLLYFGWISPAGVLVYWVTSSLLQMGQQWLTLRVIAREEGATQ